MTRRVALLAFALLQPLAAANLEISRPSRLWEFADAVGPKAAWLGAEDGTFEAFVYPLKILKNLRLRFVVDGRVMPAASLSRRIVSTPGVYTVVYTGDEFQVRETLTASVAAPAALIRLEITAYQPLRVDAEFDPDFQLMWPAAIGSSYAQWDARERAFFFGADGHPFAAVFGSPTAALASRDYLTDYHSERTDRVTLGTVKGRGDLVLAVAASVKSRDEALAAYRAVLSDPSAVIAQGAKFYDAYLSQGVQIELPDADLQRAYDWSRVSMREGLVDNPLLGRGLVAGYGPSKGVYRPGYAWFFGRDSFWTSFALDSDGDFATSRAAIEFVARFQRDDGKMPHEISQSASLVDWFHQFPYGYASADSTPLFAVAVAGYAASSGDIAFAREQWPRLKKALAFMRSTLDEDGFPKNLDVGTGWVEGGPLLPVRVELYQAACYVESLRSLAWLAAALGESDLSKQLDGEYREKRAKLGERFWIPQSHGYAFATGTDGKPVDQPSVLATVPMWFGVLDEGHAQEMIERLAAEDHASDWGMRILSSRSSLYDPSGYHFGSVWPLFTGWASVGEYVEHEAAPALANLRANAWLALDGAGGNTTEVLSGATYTPLSTASPHQTWSAAMVVSPLLRGLFGLSVDAMKRRITLDPHLPADWSRAALKNVKLGGTAVNFLIERDDDTLKLTITNSGAAFDLSFAPVYPPCTKITSATLNGKKLSWAVEAHGIDWHPRFAVSIPPGDSTIVLEQSGTFGYSIPFTSPQLGEASAALKILSERWSADHTELRLTVEGRRGRMYTIDLHGASRPANSIQVSIPAGDPASYATQTVSIRMR